MLDASTYTAPKRPRAMGGDEAMIHDPEALTHSRPGALLAPGLQSSGSVADATPYLELPALITRAASKQAYYTIRCLVDHERRLAAYRAYGYFRWVDDWLDRPVSERAERLSFIAR